MKKRIEIFKNEDSARKSGFMWPRKVMYLYLNGYPIYAGYRGEVIREVGRLGKLQKKGYIHVEDVTVTDFFGQGLLFLYK